MPFGQMFLTQSHLSLKDAAKNSIYLIKEFSLKIIFPLQNVLNFPWLNLRIDAIS
jgi:hypothetical protein